MCCSSGLLWVTKSRDLFREGAPRLLEEYVPIEDDRGCFLLRRPSPLPLPCLLPARKRCQLHATSLLPSHASSLAQHLSVASQPISPQAPTCELGSPSPPVRFVGDRRACFHI